MISVIINKHELAKFKRRAKRAYPVEILASLWGHVDGPIFHVDRIVKFKTDPDETNEMQCVVDDDEVIKSKVMAEEQGYKWLGTIHTHCGSDTWASMSETDHETGVAWGERISGVLWMYPKKLYPKHMWYRVNWELPAVVKVEYV